MWDLFSDPYLGSLIIGPLFTLALIFFVMAKSSAASQVAERRLRPIYDWLDTGNNKKALQEADKVLKKQPDFQCCKVLKCLALIRLGKEGEAETILNKVLDEVPVDEGALQAMTIAWRELQKPDKICVMYEGAVKKEPLNEDFLSHLFMSYVRMGEHKKQQMVAMNLYKAAHKNPYYFWSVMSLVLQALEGDAALGKTVHLPLALRMLQKMETDNKVEQEQEILLFCLVLEMKGDWNAAVDFLKGPLGQRLAKSGSYKTFFMSKSVEWNKNCGNWDELFTLSKEILDKMPDQWSAWQDLITATIKLDSDDKVSEVTELIESLQVNHSEMRGPLLAEMEFLSERGKVEELPNLIVKYFKKFSTKLVTYSDIIKYIDALSEEQRKEVYGCIRAWAEDKEVTSQAEICRDVIICQLARYCGLHAELTLDQMQEEVEKLVTKYLAVQPLVEDMVNTDLRPSDEYLILASHLLWDIWQQTKEDKFYLQCAVLLHWGLSTSPSNWQLKLMLIRLLTASGCGGWAYEVHSSLDIKHLMLDSLGWVLQHQLVQSGLAGLAMGQSGQHLHTMRLYNQVNKDTSDHIITAYRTGTFFQIRDIYGLKQRITNSYNLMSTNAENQLYILIHKTASHSDVLSMLTYLDNIEDEDWANKRDNRDLDTMVSWDPASSRDPEIRERSLRRELLYTRTRQLLVKCVQACVKCDEDLSQHITNGNSSAEKSELDVFLHKLKTHWTTVCSETDIQNTSELKLVPQTPTSPNLVGYTQSAQISTVTILLDVVCQMLSEKTDLNMASVTEAAEGLSSRLSELSTDVNTHSLQLCQRRELLEAITWHLETLGLAAILCGAIVTLMKGGGATGAKSGKKTKKGRGAVTQRYMTCVETVNSGIDKFNDANKHLEEIVNVLEANVSLTTLAERLQELNFNREKQDFLGEETEKVFSKMQSSFKDSFSQIKEALKHKQEYFGSIKL